MAQTGAQISARKHRKRVGKPREVDPKATWRGYGLDGSTVANRFGSTAMDFEALTDTLDGDEPEESTVHKARKTVASWVADNSGDPDEAAELMMMLGIHPKQDKTELKTLGPNNLPNPHTPARVTQK